MGEKENVSTGEGRAREKRKEKETTGGGLFTNLRQVSPAVEHLPPSSMHERVGVGVKQQRQKGG